MRVVRLLVLCLSGDVLGWSSDSHKIVARIAANNIKPKTRRFIRQNLAAKEGSWMGHSESALVQVSAWADQVLDDPAYAWSRELHFSDTPYRDCSPYVEARDCGRGSGRCIVTAIANYTERAATLSIPHEERAEAIKFLVHLVADAHSGLHVGFSEDAGGNGIHLRDPEMSLHEVWDSLLLDTFRASLELPSWVRVSTQLNGMISGNREVFADAHLTPEQLAIAGESIVTETATRVTCASAYSHNGAWIHSGDSLDDDYLVDRSGVAIDRLIKAGLRLAQVLDSVAASYFWQERVAEAALRITPATSVDANPFSCLAFTFDPEEWVYEVAVDSPTEADLFDDEIAKTRAAVLSTTPSPATTQSPEEKRAAKRRADKLRAKLNKRKIEGVDVESLVLIKRGRVFYITSKQLVVSDDWTPALFTIVSVKFADSETASVFFFDVAVFGRQLVSRNMQELTFRHLRGLKALPESAAGEFESTRVGEHHPLHPLTAKLTDIAKDEPVNRGRLAELAFDPFVSVSYESVAAFVRPAVSPLRLRELYGGTLPSDTQRQLDVLRSQADDIVRLSFGSVLLIARGRDLADASQRRWVFNKFSTVDQSSSLTKSIALFIDARLINEILTSAASKALGEYAARLLNRKKARDVVKRNTPVVKLMAVLNEYFASGQAPMAAMQLMVRCERIAIVERTDDSHLESLEYLINDDAATARASERLGLKALAGHLAGLALGMPPH